MAPLPIFLYPDSALPIFILDHLCLAEASEHVLHTIGGATYQSQQVNIIQKLRKLDST